MKKSILGIFIYMAIFNAMSQVNLGPPEQMLISNVTGTVSDGTYGGFDRLVSGEGLNPRYWTHAAHGQGDGMWLANAGTAPYWAEFNFDSVYNVGHIYVWNHNQPGLLDRGLKNVRITYTSDGSTWHEHPNMFTLTQGTGIDGISYDILDLGGVNASSVRITAAAVDGNYGSAYYGLSEVRFGKQGTTFEPSTGRTEDPLLVTDMFGRELNDYQVTLIDWQGYLYNPMIKLTLTPPQSGVSYPLTVIVSAEGSSRLMLDAPSTLSSMGASKVVTFNQFEEQSIFLEISPDRVGGGEIESYTLWFDYQGQCNSVPIKVIDQDDDLEPALPLVFDYRLDNVNGIFDAQHIREAAELAVKDWFYFFAYSSFDEVPIGSQALDMIGNDFGNWESITNDFAYNGFWIGMKGIDSGYSTGYPTGGAKFHTQNGVQVPGPLYRSAALILQVGGYEEIGPTDWSSVDDEDWYLPHGLGLYGLMHHEFGHAIAFSDNYGGLAEYKANYEDYDYAKRIIDYQGVAVPIDGWCHLSTPAPYYYDRLSGQSAGGICKFPAKTWMPMKLMLLIAEKVGWKLRDDITPFMEPEIVTENLASGAVSNPYSITLEANGGGVAFYDWTIVNGALPNGLTLNRFTGQISGIINAALGTYNFTVQLKDYDELSDPVTKNLSIVVTDANFYENLAPDATLSVSSEYSSAYGKEKMVDGITGEWGTGEWASSGETTPWVQLNWNQSVVTSKVVLYDRSNTTDQISSGTLTFSDGTSVSVDALPNDGSAKTINFSERTITWVKFQVDNGSGSNVGLSEFEVMGYYLASISNLALNKPVTVSSTYSAGYEAEKAVDGDAISTRWASATNSNSQWIYVDLQEVAAISRVVIKWQGAYGKDFTIQVSHDASTWTTIKTVTNNSSLTNDYTDLSVMGRYVRINGSAYGPYALYSIWEFEVFGRYMALPEAPMEPIGPESLDDVNITTTDVTTSVNEISTEKYSIYPNPVKEELLIKNSANDKAWIISDINGIIRIEFIGNSVNVSQLAPGLYFIRDSETVMRFIKM